MSKLIDVEKVKAEINAKIEKYTKRGEESDALHDGKSMYWGGVLSCLNEIKTMLDTLPEEKQVDLQEEITSYINKHYHIRNDETLEKGNDPLTTFDFEMIAKDFYILGLNSKQEDCPKIKGWVARDLNDCLYLFSKKPIRLKRTNEWICGFDEDYLEIDKKLFPEITWGSEPVEVEITIKELIIKKI